MMLRSVKDLNCSARKRLSTMAYFARIYIPPLFKIAVFGSPVYAYMTLVSFHVPFFLSSRSFQGYAMEYYIIIQHPPLLRAVPPLAGPFHTVCTSVLKSLSAVIRQALQNNTTFYCNHSSISR